MYFGEAAAFNGSINATGDYTVSPVTFSIAPPMGMIFDVARLIVTMEVVSSLSVTGYGSDDFPLTNGITVERWRMGESVDVLTAFPLFTNVDWASQCYDAKLLDLGPGVDCLLIRWTFGRVASAIRVNGSVGESLNVVLNDDFSGLLRHRFVFEGDK